MNHNPHITGISKTERVLAIFQLLFAGAVLCLVTTTLYQYIGELKKMLGDNVSYLKIARNFHFSILVSSLAFASAILVLKRNSYGWLLSIVSWLLYAITFLTGLFDAILKKKTDNFYLVSGIILVSLASITFAIYLFVRLTKSHQVNLKHFIIPGSILLLLLLDYWIIK